MESLDEFDNEYPLIITFCERISPQDFEKQSLSYTQKSLQDLYTQMEQNPRICERILRKRKQMENEEAGVVQYLKAKFFAMLQGDMNYSNLMEEMEMGEKAEQLKREMQKASDYAGNGEIPEFQHGLEAALGWHVYGQSEEDQTYANIVLCLRVYYIVDLRPLMLNPGGFRPPYLGSNSFCRLKYSSFPRTPINSPTSSQSAGPSSSGSVFNTPILAKFRDNKDDEKDNENLRPGSHFTEP
ncbi:UNVERIFIED_CONTAM: hypothetical protein K2H54_029217 [Gekko kuhli]